MSAPNKVVSKLVSAKYLQYLQVSSGNLLEKWIKRYIHGRIRQLAIFTLESSFFKKLQNWGQTDQTKDSTYLLSLLTKKKDVTRNNLRDIFEGLK